METHAPRVASKICSSLIALLGAVVLFGWAAGLDALTSVLPGLATMKPATAVCFLASGVSLGMVTAARPRGWAQRGLSVAVALLGSLTVLEYRLAWDAGFDGLFLWDVQGEGPYPARMSEMTAVSFALTGTALALARGRDAWRWTHGLAMLVAAIALTALVGYWYGVEALYAIDPFSSMALHTALGFAAAAAGLLLVHPDRGLVALLGSDSFGGVTVRRYLIPSVALPLTVGWLQVRAVRGGTVDLEFGVAAVATATALLLAGLVTGYGWWLARTEERRAELEAQLFRAQRMESVGRLAGGIAHDFNNVLTIVLSTVELLDHDVPETAHADLRTIRDACTKASVLTRQLLALGRKQALEPEVLSVNDVLEENRALVRSLVPESVALATELADDLGNVSVDAGKLEQVVLNLVVNAVDAMPAGGTLTIETRNMQLNEAYAERHVDVKPGPYVVLVVSDTGFGMDAGTIERIFEPFYTTKAPGKGTGLGLATSYGIVRQSGGHIWVYSEVGRGTAFKIYLPRVDEPAAAAKAAPKRVSDRPRPTESVLVVDDDDELGRVVAEVLRRAGYTVHLSTDGTDAVQFLGSHDGSIDLVLTDVTMPAMGGRDLVESLLEMRPETRFLYMSGYADEEVVRESRGGYLEKPFTPTELLRRVREMLHDPE